MKYTETKLIVFLKTLSNSEISEFSKFLQSPFFKQSRDPLPLFNILKKFHPDFSSNEFNEENVFQELYPDLKFTDKKSKDVFRTITSALFKSAEEFIFFSKIKGDNVLRNKIILKELLDRDLTKYYEQNLQTAINELDSDEANSGNNFLEKYYLEKLNTRFYSLSLDFNKLYEHSNKSVELISVYFLLDLIRTAKINILYGQRRNLNAVINMADKMMEKMNMEEILKIHENTPHYFQLCFNYYSLRCLKDSRENELYEKAKKMFLENRASINRFEKIFYYADLVNIAISRNDSLTKGMMSDALMFFKLCIEDKAYKVSDEDFMQPDFYRNVIIASESAKDYSWMEYFINNYTSELKPEYINNMEHYSRSLLHYGKGEFETSLEEISKVNYDLDHFKLDTKILMLKIFYELNLYEQARSMADTFKHFIRNSDKIRPQIKESYGNFLKYYLKILNMKTESKKDKPGFLNDIIKNEKLIFQKSWLLEKSNQI